MTDVEVQQKVFFSFYYHAETDMQTRSLLIISKGIADFCSPAHFTVWMAKFFTKFYVRPVATLKYAKSQAEKYLACNNFLLVLFGGFFHT